MSIRNTPPRDPWPSVKIRVVKSHYYSQHAAPLRAELGVAISRDLMREFHRKAAWRHLLVAARQFGILAVATWVLIRVENPLVWVPVAVVQLLRKTRIVPLL